MKPHVSSRPPLSRPSVARAPRPIAGIPWQVWASGPIPSNPNLCDVTVQGVAVHVEGFGCSFDVEGSLTGLFDNTTDELDFDGDLIVSEAACPGLVNEYDVVHYSATYHVTG